MALRLCDVQRDAIASRALKALMHHYTVAEEKSRLVLTKKAGDMKLLLHDLDDLHQLDFVHNQQMVKEVERLRVLSTTIDQQRESWKARALMAEAQLLEVPAKTSNNGGRQNVSDVRYASLKRFRQSSSTLITPPDKASRRLFETRSSRKSGMKLAASIKDSRPPISRRRGHLRRLDQVSAAPRCSPVGGLAASWLSSCANCSQVCAMSIRVARSMRCFVPGDKLRAISKHNRARSRYCSALVLMTPPVGLACDKRNCP